MVREDLLSIVPVTDDPEIRARQRHVALVLLDMDPELKQELIQQWIAERFMQWFEQRFEQRIAELVQRFERRLARAVTEEERLVLRAQLWRLGGARLDEMAQDLSAEALAAWLADPEGG